jgi:membrane protein DedA with SNARE-associated domain
MGPAQLARAELTFKRRGAGAVFFGRFVALLRILAGLLAGALRMPYSRFLAANTAGGVCWACATTFLVYGLGEAADRWLQDASWIALVVVVLAGVATTLFLRWRARRVLADHVAEPAVAGGATTPGPAGPAQ